MLSCMLWCYYIISGKSSASLLSAIFYYAMLMMYSVNALSWFQFPRRSEPVSSVEIVFHRRVVTSVHPQVFLLRSKLFRFLRVTVSVLHSVLQALAGTRKATPPWASYSGCARNHRGESHGSMVRECVGCRVVGYGVEVVPPGGFDGRDSLRGHRVEVPRAFFTRPLSRLICGSEGVFASDHAWKSYALPMQTPKN